METFGTNLQEKHYKGEHSSNEDQGSPLTKENKGTLEGHTGLKRRVGLAHSYRCGYQLSGCCGGWGLGEHRLRAASGAREDSSWLGVGAALVRWLSCRVRGSAAGQGNPRSRAPRLEDIAGFPL